MFLKVKVSLLGADCPVDCSTGADPSLKSHANHSVLNCGVVLSLLPELVVNSMSLAFTDLTNESDMIMGV